MEIKYPPQIANTPRISPFEISKPDTWHKKLRYYFKSIDVVQWEKFVKVMLDYYDKILIKKKGENYLPKGTVLYHSSLKYPVQFDNKNRFTFFGLDIIISIWYVLEQILVLDNQNCVKKPRLFPRSSSYLPRYGFLYQYRTTKDLPIKIIKTIREHPTEKRYCLNKRHICLHPQISMHSGSYNLEKHHQLYIYDLCTEITLYYDYYKKYIDLEHISVIDPLILYKNAYKVFNQWNPINAIIGEKIPWYNLISCQDFDKKKDKLILSKNLISRESLIKFYQKYNPNNIPFVDEMLEKYEHTRLLGHLEKTYGIIPELNVI